MLVWATEFPLADHGTIDLVLPHAKRWLDGSQHHPWQMADFDDDEPSGEITKYEKIHDETCQTEFVSVAKLELNDGRGWAGLRHVWRELSEKGDRHWVTEIVGFESDGAVWLSVRVNCEVSNPIMHLPVARKPYLVKTLIKELGGGDDGGLLVSDQPRFLAEQDVIEAARMISGTFGNRLPVVYVSADWDGRQFVDPAKLAQWMSGSGHVVVEPSEYFSFELARQVEGQNAYGGAVGIYWPSATGQQIRLLPQYYSDGDEMAREISRHVRDSHRYVRPIKECTWNHLRRQLAEARISSLATKAEEVQMYEEEVDDLARQLQQKDHEIQQLIEEKKQLESERYLIPGSEKELYEGEFRETLLYAIQQALPKIFAEGRRRDILNSLTAANENSRSGGESEIRNAVKKAFATDQNLSKNDRKRLRTLGFDFNQDKKHRQLIFRDSRYVFPLANTPSDHRAAKNLAGMIQQKLFQ